MSKRTMTRWLLLCSLAVIASTAQAQSQGTQIYSVGDLFIEAWEFGLVVCAILGYIAGRLR
jgi:hypothetical protein